MSKTAHKVPASCFAGYKADGSPMMVTSRCPHCKESVMWLPIDDGSPSGSARCLSAVGMKKSTDGEWVAFAHGDTCKGRKRGTGASVYDTTDPFLN